MDKKEQIKQAEEEQEVPIIAPILCYSCEKGKLSIIGRLFYSKLLLKCDGCGTLQELPMGQMETVKPEPPPANKKKEMSYLK